MRVITAVLLAAGFFATPAQAQTIRIAYIDPLSGGGSSVGEMGLKHFQYLADQINAKGGLNGKKLEIVGYDNKINPQESLVQVQKAIDAPAFASSRKGTARASRRRSAISSPSTMTAIPAKKSSTSTTRRPTRC